MLSAKKFFKFMPSAVARMLGEKPKFSAVGARQVNAVPLRNDLSLNLAHPAKFNAAQIVGATNVVVAGDAARQPSAPEKKQALENVRSSQEQYRRVWGQRIQRRNPGFAFGDVRSFRYA